MSKQTKQERAARALSVADRDRALRLACRLLIIRSERPDILATIRTLANTPGQTRSEALLADVLSHLLAEQDLADRMPGSSPD